MSNRTEGQPAADVPDWVDPNCPLQYGHGWSFIDDGCICLSSWLGRLAEEADETWMNEPYMPWEN